MEKVANEASDDEIITVLTFVSSLPPLPLHHDVLMVLRSTIGTHEAQAQNVDCLLHTHTRKYV